MNKVHNESNSLKQAQQLSQQEQINQDQAQTQVNTSKQSDPIKSPNPVQITCENCNQTGQTEVKRELNLKAVFQLLKIIL
ncbi:LITAF-like zinc ribbon domain protein (macronuclear) [Tetrahymena thermophila SB210]|uniref:LITAF-like zinc ribbon domain protein n=1 Tax=Tetrahymena thermophila (strain SB210) TaxID=312017 RepID=Q23YV7_TETTS|nr:LITAF-like zinc ribbon domain protein [Tetrahymena thermophila SB210]EAS01698.2 LITAF-like zinc ribbon domain protein [Tetrahymena thermophila SB210]|eukprot:XP_001021943.2 LITAF-like zinc ribbon domain protein [Tetrahymena thermophila SB210]